MNNKKRFSVVSDQKNRENEKTGEKGINKITDIDSVLKDHLKASISMERLEVSEDLVQRTLQKIKQSENGISSDDNNRKEQFIKYRNRNIRGLISAAAAIVLVVSSVTVWQSGLISGNNNNAKQKDEMIIMESAPITESAEGSSEYGIMSQTNESAEADMTAKGAEEGTTAGADIADSSLLLPENTKVGTTLAATVFSLNYAISYKDVTAFEVTPNDKKTISVTKKVDKVEELYNILDQYEMSILTNPSNENWIYTADISLQDNKEIKIFILEDGSIAVTNELSEEKTYYSLSNGVNFLKEFKDLISTIN